MKIIFFGSPNFVIPILDILNQRYEVVAAVTAPDKKVGRKQIVTPSPVKQFATEHNIPVLTPKKLSEINSQLAALNSQLFIVAAYGEIIPQEILDLPKYGSINIHPSALPKYRGPSPIPQTLLNGDKKSAISVMQMNAQMDHGPILKKISYNIPNTATTQTLTNDMFQKSTDILPDIIDAYIAGKITPTPQSHDQATYTKIITKQDGYIDLENPPSPEQLDRMIRAYFPWPTVWGKVRIKNKEFRIKFLPFQACHSHERGNPEDTNISYFEKTFCVQLEGGKPMPIKDFLNGYPELREKLEKLFAKTSLEL